MSVVTPARRSITRFRKNKKMVYNTQPGRSGMKSNWYLQIYTHIPKSLEEVIKRKTSYIFRFLFRVMELNNPK